MAQGRSIRSIPQQRTAMPEQPPAQRCGNFSEVTLGLDEEAARREASRCLLCPSPACVDACPVHIDIPGFIERIGRDDVAGAYQRINEASLLPAVCGRVCPQERQCEGACVVGRKLEPVAIGHLERYVGDQALKQGWTQQTFIQANPHKIGIIGSGPAGMACAADLAKAGCKVTIFEALHASGGVLRYGIPEFRLPKTVVNAEYARLQELGVEIRHDALIGRLYTLQQLREEMGYAALFIATGAGAPRFLDLPGESLNGVISANELLTRCNLMRASDFPQFATPLEVGRKIAVIGAGNTAMDALRSCLRLGAEEVHCIYRRSEEQCPAREEELAHAKDEGVRFHWLNAPLEIIDNGQGQVAGLRCQPMRLSQPDSDGRLASEPGDAPPFTLELDTVIYAIGTQPNPILGQTAKLGLDDRGYIQTDETLATSMAGVFAGGDIVTGAATVIEAMGAGRQAAASIKRYLRLRDSQSVYADTPASGLEDMEQHFLPLRLQTGELPC